MIEWRAWVETATRKTLPDWVNVWEHKERRDIVCAGGLQPSNGLRRGVAIPKSADGTGIRSRIDWLLSAPGQSAWMHFLSNQP